MCMNEGYNNITDILKLGNLESKITYIKSKQHDKHVMVSATIDWYKEIIEIYSEIFYRSKLNLRQDMDNFNNFEEKNISRTLPLVLIPEMEEKKFHLIVKTGNMYSPKYMYTISDVIDEEFKTYKDIMSNMKLNFQLIVSLGSVFRKERYSSKRSKILDEFVIENMDYTASIDKEHHPYPRANVDIRFLELYKFVKKILKDRDIYPLHYPTKESKDWMKAYHQINNNYKTLTIVKSGYSSPSGTGWNEIRTRGNLIIDFPESIKKRLENGENDTLTDISNIKDNLLKIKNHVDNYYKSLSKLKIKDFEKYFSSLPNEIKSDLEKIGRLANDFIDDNCKYQFDSTADLLDPKRVEYMVLIRNLIKEFDENSNDFESNDYQFISDRLNEVSYYIVYLYHLSRYNMTPSNSSHDIKSKMSLGINSTRRFSTNINGIWLSSSNPQVSKGRNTKSSKTFIDFRNKHLATVTFTDLQRELMTISEYVNILIDSIFDIFNDIDRYKNL